MQPFHSGFVTKQTRALFDKLQKLGTPSEIFLLLNDNSVLWFVGFETILSDINLEKNRENITSIHKGEKRPTDLHTDDHTSSKALLLNKIALVARKARQGAINCQTLGLSSEWLICHAENFPKIIIYDPQFSAQFPTRNKILLFKVVKTNWTHHNRPFLDTSFIMCCLMKIAEKVTPNSIFFLSSPIQILYWFKLLTEVSASKVPAIPRN